MCSKSDSFPITEILDFLSKQAQLPEGTVQLNKEVTKINWDRSHGLKVKVTCQDGSLYEADHVISTISLGEFRMYYIVACQAHPALVKQV